MLLYPGWRSFFSSLFCYALFQLCKFCGTFFISAIDFCLQDSQKAKVCRQFERFCKDVLECESIDYIRHITARAEHVITFSDLPEPVLEQLHTTDTYPSDMYLFDVCGFHLPIHDDRLGQALLEIGVEGYSILLLSFLLDLSDRQIALLLNSSKSSIQRRRTAFFETLKSKMKE